MNFAKMEEMSDFVVRRGKRFLPTISRLLLVSTYLEDAVRMFSWWDSQVSYVQSEWSFPAFIGHMFVFMNMMAQLTGSVMVLLQFKVVIGCIILLSNICLQILVYKLLTEVGLLMRVLSIGGGVVLLYVESLTEGKTMFASLPSLGENKPKQWLQLSGRLLLVLMILSLIRLDPTDKINFITSLFSVAIAILIAVGFKTRPVALFGSVILFIFNMFAHPFWNFSSEELSYVRDFIKYDFFQTLSAIGGLLMLVSVGPGDVSFDERKKKW